MTTSIVARVICWNPYRSMAHRIHPTPRPHPSANPLGGSGPDGAVARLRKLSVSRARCARGASLGRRGRGGCLAPIESDEPSATRGRAFHLGVKDAPTENTVVCTQVTYHHAVRTINFAQALGFLCELKCMRALHNLQNMTSPRLYYFLVHLSLTH